MQTHLMRLANLERRSIALRPGAQKRAMRQIGGPNLRARQMLDVFKVQIVVAVVEHVDHLVRQHALHHALAARNVLAHDDLIQFGIVATADRHIAHLARDVPPDVDGAFERQFGEKCGLYGEWKINGSSSSYHPELFNAPIISLTIGLSLMHDTTLRSHLILSMFSVPSMPNRMLVHLGLYGVPLRSGYKS